jgi:CheY-like chemotaxis protein
MPNFAPYVLVVDDFPDGREMLAEYLGFRGFTVVEATSGEAALELARKRRPALILMDLEMPGIGGWEATRQLKADPRTRGIPIIALSAHAMAPDEGIARRAGCDGFLSKPFEIRAVGDAVEQVLRRARTEGL